MEFKEFGNKEGKKLVLLPGTACTWQLNFKNIIDELSKKYWIIAVNYDGFEGDNTKVFTDVPTVTSKIEDYILENHDGKVDGAYGSSLGGSFVGLLIQRKIIHIEHGFIGGSDLDQGGKIFARILFSLLFRVLQPLNISDNNIEHIIRTLRGFLEGFVLLVNNNAFGNPISIKESFDLSLDIIFNGIKLLEGVE